MALVLEGVSNDGINITITLDGRSLPTELLETVPLGDHFYVILETKKKFDDIESGSILIFDFDGDLATMTGDYRLADDDECARVRKVVLGDDDPGTKKPPETKKTPEPKKKPEPTKKTPEPKKPEPKKPSSSARSGAGFGYNPKAEKIAKARNVFYIIGMIYGFGAILFYMGFGYLIGFTLRSTNPDAIDALSNNVPLILVIAFSGYAQILNIISGLSCLDAYKKRDDMTNPVHNATMLLGVVTFFNLFALIAGWLNYRYRVSSRKVRPEEE